MDESDVTAQRAELLQEIEHDEADVRVGMHELARAAGSKLDVREYIKRFPVAWAIGGLLVGLWLGSRGTETAALERRRSW